MRFYPASHSLLPLRRKYCVISITLFYKIPAPASPCMRETNLRTHIQTTCKIVFLYEYFSLSRSKILRTASFVEDRSKSVRWIEDLFETTVKGYGYWFCCVLFFSGTRNIAVSVNAYYICDLFTFCIQTRNCLTVKVGTEFVICVQLLIIDKAVLWNTEESLFDSR
jgi:hypothetical protein